MQTRHFVLAGLVIVLVAQTAFYYPILPAMMSSHFDGAGDANGWMTKGSFLLFEAVILGFIIAEMTALPWLVSKMPNTLINLPNKEYWLAPERREYAFEIFGSYFQWFSVGLIALMIGVNQLVYRANLTRRPLDSAMWLILGIYLIFVIIWLAKFVMAFRKPI